MTDVHSRPERDDGAYRSRSEAPRRTSALDEAGLPRAIFDASLDAMILCDEEGNYLEVNAAACALFGRSREDLVGRRSEELFVEPADRIDALREVVRREGKVRGELVVRRPSGELRHVEFATTESVMPGVRFASLHDVTDRVRAEEAARDAKASFERMFRASPVPMALTELDGGKYADANDLFLELVGATREELLGRSSQELGLYERREDRERLAAEVRRHGRVRDFEVWGGAQDDLRCVLVNSEVIELGGTRYILSALRDVTGERRHQEARQKAEETTRMVVENAPIILFATDVDGIYTVSTGRGLETLGLEPGQVVGTSAIEAFGHASFTELGGERMHGEEAMRRVLAGAVLRGRTEIGTTWFDTVLQPLADEDGTVLGVMGLATDVTREHKAEQRLKRLMDADLLGVLVAHVDGRVLEANDAFLRMLNYTRAEFEAGLDWRQISPPEEAHQDMMAMERVRTEGRCPPYEREFLRRDGSRCRVLVGIARDEPGATAAAYVLDVSARRKAEAELEEKREMQRRLEEQLHHAQRLEAVGRLAGGIAHDFNNMMSVVKGFGLVMRDEMPESDPSREDLEQILEAADRATQLTGQLLAFGRKQVLEPAVIDPNELVERLEKMLKRLLGEDIELVTRMRPDVGKIFADRSKIEQVLVNLAVNARDAMPHGGVLTIETSEVMLSTSDIREPDVSPGRHVRLRVSDTGEGMRQITLDRIFEPFFTTKEQGRGTGLGLATVHGIVKQSGGHITVQSCPDEGTTFDVYLPRAQGEGGRTSVRPIRSTQRLRGRETILIVEDESLVLQLTTQVLRRNGYAVLEARSGGEALLIAERHPGKVDLLLTDVVMPWMSGPDLVQRVKAQAMPDMRYLFMSAYAGREADNLPDDVPLVSKPFSPRELLEAVRSVLDGAHDGVLEGA